ncbi:MAG: SRPBCC family protein [Candidatus Sulfopaludibacter sp.]|nr:SRPBCC family protein [Candidatus Sulfopaludibacter sp.]
MEERTVLHSTFVIERSYPVTPERVFAAFSDPGKKRRWFAEGAGRDVEEFTMDFRVGGNSFMRSRFKPGSPFPGNTLDSHIHFQDIVPNQRLVYAYTMSMDGRRFSASLATFMFVATATGTDLIFTDQGAFFEGSDGPQMREQGWRKLLENLAAHLASQPEIEPAHAAPQG